MSTAANNAGGNRPHGQVYGGSPTGGRATPRVPAKKKPKGPIWAKILVGFGALLIVASVGTFTTVKLVLKRVEAAIPTDDLLPQVDGGDTRTLDGALNILLVGTDERAGLDGNRADTIIVLHINANHDSVYLLSIPRDTLATIPPFPKAKFKGTKDKINSAFQAGSGNGLGRKGGFELLTNTVTQLTGIPIFDAGAIINFDGFTAVVEALGKVHMCIDSRTTSLDHDRNGKELFNRTKEAMVYEKGCRDLLPWQALDYVRQRKSLPDGDYGRQRHQQQFIKAIAHDAMSQGLTDPVKLNKVLGAAGQALTIDKGNASLAEWLFLVKGLPIQDMIMLKANGGKYAPVPCGAGECEHLTDESLAMFAAAKNDTLPAFIQTHPTWVADQSGSGEPTPSAGPSTTARPSAR